MTQSQPLENSVHLCRLGQEIVQEIVLKCTELFSLLKAIQPPVGSAQSKQAYEDKNSRMKSCVATITILFERLHAIYDKTLEACCEFAPIQPSRLIPFRDGIENTSASTSNQAKKSDQRYQQVSVEYKKRMEVLQARNKHLKDIIDSTRNLVWDINSMLAMRRP